MEANGIELLNLIFLISAVMGLILFIKVWAMTNDIKGMKYQIRAIKNYVTREAHFQYGQDTSYNAFKCDIEEIEEMMYCEQMGEARFRLKKLEYNLNILKQYHEESGYECENKEEIKIMEDTIYSLLKELEK